MHKDGINSNQEKSSQRFLAFQITINLPGVLLASVLLLAGCQSKEITSAKIYIQGNQWDMATKLLEEAIEVHPDNPEAHFLLGRAYGRNGNFKDMNREFELSLMLANKFKQQIISEREKYWIDKYNAGVTALSAKVYLQAETLFQNAITIDASRSEAYKKLAVIYLSMSKTNKALQLYRKLLEKHPQDLDLLASTANLYYSQQQYSNVIPILNRMLKIEPDHWDALANLALSYDALGETEEAYKAYLKAIQTNPEDKDLVFLFGVFHYKRKRYPEAIQLFEQVLASNSDDVESISNIGNAYLSMAEELRVKLRSAKNGGHSRSEIQNLKEQIIRHYQDAIPYLQKSVESEPAKPNQWRNLGVAYINTGQKEKGEQALLKAEELKVNSKK